MSCCRCCVRCRVCSPGGRASAAKRRASCTRLAPRAEPLERRASMTLAILGLGAAVPPTSVTQHEGQQIARWVCCHKADHAAWLPHIYANSGIDKRHMCLGRAVIRDILDEKRESQSI